PAEIESGTRREGSGRQNHHAARPARFRARAGEFREPRLHPLVRRPGCRRLDCPILRRCGPLLFRQGRSATVPDRIVSAVQARFLLGPAGSGKTFRCLAEIRAELLRAPDGPPLILLAPKQATFQLERQLLGWGERPREPKATNPEGSPGVSPHQQQLNGYTRLRILS